VDVKRVAARRGSGAGRVRLHGARSGSGVLRR
jgi:hypothetical protein